jgi:hypothetical protein
MMGKDALKYLLIGFTAAVSLLALSFLPSWVKTFAFMISFSFVANWILDKAKKASEREEELKNCKRPERKYHLHHTYYPPDSS